MVPVVVHATLSGKWELITCNTFSMLYGDLPTASQSSTGAHADRTMATGFLHPLEPQAPPPAGNPADNANCLAVRHCWPNPG